MVSASPQPMKTKKRTSKKTVAVRDASWPPGWTEELEREFQEAAGPHVYDKADWHSEGDFPKGLPEKQAFVHTGLFMGWLIEHNLISREFTRQFGRNLRTAVERFKRRAITGPGVYEMWGGALDSDMLTPAGNQFAGYYYDGNRFANDYRKLLTRRLPSFYHVQDTWANYDILAPRIDARYEAWKKSHGKAKRGR